MMKVVSLNISAVKAVAYLEKTVLTGIFKQPSQDKIWVNKTHLQGDAQADLTVHGGEYKAVYAFSADHYAYWRNTLCQPDLRYGVFGENLTITALDEAQLCIGDHLQVGECILQISQPRVPCFKLGIALKDKKAPGLFTKSGATGIYFSVVQAGFVAPGDEVKRIKKDPHEVSVESLFRAYYDRGFADSETVFEAALKVEALAPEWQEKVRKKLKQSGV